MAGQPEITNMALFCDFENVALGVRDAKYAAFDISKVLERLLLKGSIVVKKAYCDWERYKDFKATMHGAAFELIEIPHVRQSGKNSADIRMVVDALDLCYTKSYVDTFVIISEDYDFSPLVSKLRENNKYVIGIGVNVNHERFPEALAPLATSLRIETGRTHSRLELLVRLLLELERYYNRFIAEGAGPIVERFSQVSSFARGKRVQVETAAETFTGITDGLEPNGLLRVRRDGGRVEPVVSGSIREAS